MKLKLLSAALVLMIAPFGANAKARDFADALSSFLSKGITKDNRQVFCKIGKDPKSIKEFMTGDFDISLHTGKGILANISAFAAIGENLCGKKNIEGYNDSEFHKIALATLAGPNSENVIEKSMSNLHSLAYNTFCENKEKLPEHLKFVANFCPTAK